ncbi:MAG: hypothetical protein IIC18_05305 [Bacteroidetes bacterium]|nr:hypothetical protein [Bacteroidota bacterium]
MPEKEFRVKQIFPEGMEPIAIKGALGSVLNDGTITMHLYSEYKTIADMHVHDIDEDNNVNLNEITRRESDSELTRVFHTSISISPHTAKQFAVWLIERAQEADKLFTGLDEEEHDEHDSTN